MERNTLVWDLPTRLLHVTLAGSFVAAWLVAQTSDDESARFVVHMLFGGLAAVTVALRVVWGFVGSRYARFASFVPGIGALVRYLASLAARPGRAPLGHNAGSAPVIYAMLAAVLGTAASGVWMGRWEALEEVHEVLANGLMVLAAIHVAGVLVHTLRHRDALPLSMIDGRKVGDAKEGIESAHPGVAAVFALTVLGAGIVMVRGYDATTGTVTLPGVGALALGEAGEGPQGAEPGAAPLAREQGQEGEEDDDD